MLRYFSRYLKKKRNKCPLTINVMCTAFIICIQFVFSRDIFALLQQLNKSSQPWQTQSSHWTMYTCTTIQQPVAVPPSLWLYCRTRDTLIFKKWHRKIRHSLLQYHKIRYIVTSLLFRLDRRGKSSKTSNWWAVTRSFSARRYCSVCTYHKKHIHACFFICAGFEAE